ncbi:MAG: sirohydrochlorin chelatase [Aureliella sp.]
MSDDSIGYLLVGHGTRKPAGAEQLRRVFEQLKPLLPPGRSAYCFLELAEPTIADAIEQLAQSGAQQLVVVPLLLFTAGHAIDDIPDAVAEACSRFGVKVLHQTPSLGCDPAILRLSALRFRQAVCGVTDAPSSNEPFSVSPACDGRQCAASHCGGSFCSQAAMVFVGRGSKSADATSQMRRFAELRRNLTPVAWLQTSFLHGQEPDVTTALEALAQTDHPIAIVQPHLLFEGLLMDELRQRVAELQRAAPERRWILVDTLGTDQALARALAQLVHAARESVLAENYAS